MTIGRGQISAQIDGKLRGAKGEKKKKLIAKNLRSSKFSQKVIQSKKLYNRKKDINGNFRDYDI
jgi:hypothetical protein